MLNISCPYCDCASCSAVTPLISSEFANEHIEELGMATWCVVKCETCWKFFIVDMDEVDETMEYDEMMEALAGG